VAPTPPPTSTPLATPPATAAVTEPPTQPPTATPEPTPAPTSTPTCTMTVDQPPEFGVKVFFSGMGFKPDIDIVMTFTTPTDEFTFGGPNDPHPRGLHTNEDGAFGPWDVTYGSEDPPGTHTLTASDGECEASLSFELTR